jgi:nucleoside-diphosphate-sugar epimerase
VDGVRTAFVTGGSGFIGGALLRRLAGEGWRIRALARSERSAARVAEAGAEPVEGELDSVEAMTAGAEGCELAFHAAAHVSDWGPREEFERLNVEGTRNVVAACEAAGCRRLVHVGTEAALMAGQPLVQADETAPLRPDSPAPYSSTKARAEQIVREANQGGLETVVLRPRFVWGPGDTSVLPGLVEAVESGTFRWVDGGRHLTETTHVDNTVEGLVLAAEKGRPGEAYFVTDGEPIEFRDFITRLLATQQVEVPDRNVPARLVRASAPLVEGAWRLLRRRSHPPITRFASWFASQECTIDITKARTELGYTPVKDREEGLRELSAA